MGPEKQDAAFWRKVRAGKRQECWLWMGAEGPRGYGKLKRARRWIFAHRHAWALKHGAIPYGMQVLHKCDNPPCCNPSHLFLGTARDNVEDMVKKGRASWQRPKTEAA